MRSVLLTFVQRTGQLYFAALRAVPRTVGGRILLCYPFNMLRVPCQMDLTRQYQMLPVNAIDAPIRFIQIIWIARTWLLPSFIA